jgi:hypothetical protein
LAVQQGNRKAIVGDRTDGSLGIAFKIASGGPRLGRVFDAMKIRLRCSKRAREAGRWHFWALGNRLFSPYSLDDVLRD